MEHARLQIANTHSWDGCPGRPHNRRAGVVIERSEPAPGVVGGFFGMETHTHAHALEVVAREGGGQRFDEVSLNPHPPPPGVCFRRWDRHGYGGLLISGDVGLPSVAVTEVN